MGILSESPHILSTQPPVPCQPTFEEKIKALRDQLDRLQEVIAAYECIDAHATYETLEIRGFRDTMLAGYGLAMARFNIVSHKLQELENQKLEEKLQESRPVFTTEPPKE